MEPDRSFSAFPKNNVSEDNPEVWILSNYNIATLPLFHMVNTTYMYRE